MLALKIISFVLLILCIPNTQLSKASAIAATSNATNHEQILTLKREIGVNFMEEIPFEPIEPEEPDQPANNSPSIPVSPCIYTNCLGTGGGAKELRAGISIVISTILLYAISRFLNS